MTNDPPKAPLAIRQFQIEDESAVIELWRRCDLLRPQNGPHKDILRKLMVQPELFLIAEMDGRVAGSAMCAYGGHRGFINYFGVDPEYQRRGIATALMREAEKMMRAMGCPKINLQVRASNKSVIDFYRSVGFELDDVVSMGKRLEKD
jgi:ribosomal protein S18 acetylase RimI-like enzyme